MIQRDAKETLLRLSSQFPVVSITGPRQSGKTTLAKYVFPNKDYITFDDRDIREIAQASPKDFLLAFPNGLIIDEAQKVPDIFDAIKYYVDKEEHQPGKYIVTGSSQLKLRENISDSLAGRVGNIRLLPFTVNEVNKKDFGPYDYIFKGLYPPLYDESKHFIPEDWYENYISTYIDLDVKEHINEKNISIFRKFLQICAMYSGQVLNMDAISRSVGISAPTVRSWLSILEESYIIYLLEADCNNLGKSLIKSPKLYFLDTGLLCYLLRIFKKEELLLSQYKGAIVESFVVSELIKGKTNKAKRVNLSYFRDANGFEVDLLASWNREYVMEIKSGSKLEKNYEKNLKKYEKLRNDEVNKIVLYLGETSIKGDDISYISYLDFGKIEI